MANEQSNSVPDDQQQQAVEKAVIDSNDFFDRLDNSVNGMAGEGDQPQEAHNIPTEATHVNSGSEQGNPRVESHGSNSAWDDDNNPYKKRYQDSSREAVKMNQQLRQLKPFVPVLDAMKRDSGLVQHVREYLQNGGKPSGDVKKNLGLAEDFQYDPNEAVQNPESDSERVMNAQVEAVVNNRVSDILKQEKTKAVKSRVQLAQKQQAIDFIKRHKMTKEQFQDFAKQANSRRLTFDDVYFLLNKDKQNQNVANAAKTDMLNQMKNARTMPTSASDSNNQGYAKPSRENEIFDAIAGLDGSVDDLFG